MSLFNYLVLFFIGIIAFLIVEKTVRIVRGGDGHGHSHSYEDYNSKIGKLKKSEKDKMSDEEV